MFITDVLLYCLVSRTQYASNVRGLSQTRDYTKPVMSCQLDTSELVKLLQQSAVKHLTLFRQLEAREFSSIVIVTTDFEALYAYKCGEYRRCLQLSMHNVRTLLVADIAQVMPSYPEFIQLMGDDIASLIGLILIVKESSREESEHVFISQLPLSLYLMSQCQMKLHHSLTSLAYVEVASRNTYCMYWTLDQLLLKLTERKLLRHLVRTAIFHCVFFH